MGSSSSKYKICFKHSDTNIELNASGSLDTTVPNKCQLMCTVDGTLYKSNIAVLQNSIHLFNKVLFIYLINI